jgi:hypothetical protein
LQRIWIGGIRKILATNVTKRVLFEIRLSSVGQDVGEAELEIGV